MTTTEIPLGIEDGKPSSRVLRPPGGGSSFTLGGADETPPPQKPRQSASDASPAAQTSSPETKSAPMPDNTKAEGKAQSCKPVENSHSRIFGDPGPATGSPSRGRNLSKGASAFNPITGEVYPGFEHIVTDLDSNLFGRSPSRAGASPVTGEQTKTPEQSLPKVRQPPGGFSHGIF